jgi:hypothetical protein
MKPRSATLYSSAEALQKVFGFDEADLAANQRGEISERQRAWLLRRLDLGAIVVPVVIVCLWAATFAFFRQTGPLPQMAVTFIALFLLMPTLILVIWLVSDTWKIRRDLAEGRVLVAEGAARRELRQPQRRGPAYRPQGYIILGERDAFPVSDAAYEAFADGVYYRLYYLPHFYRLLSAEVCD